MNLIQSGATPVAALPQVQVHIGDWTGAHLPSVGGREGLETCQVQVQVILYFLKSIDITFDAAPGACGTVNGAFTHRCAIAAPELARNWVFETVFIDFKSFASHEHRCGTYEFAGHCLLKLFSLNSSQ